MVTSNEFRSASTKARRDGDAAQPFLAVLIAAALLVTSCTTMIHPKAATRLQQTAGLIEDVKGFGKGLGIEPTEALSRTAGNGPALSMLWLWMQRAGTLALRGPVDIRLAIGYSSENERIRIEQVYRVDDYSVYYRQGSEFADARSVATVGFSDEPIVRRVKVILHEDLHGDVNFALPWEIEEGIVTPLGSLAAVEYFRWKNEQKDLQNAVTSLGEERVMSQELNALMAQADKIFAQNDVDTAKEKVLGVARRISPLSKTVRKTDSRPTSGNRSRSQAQPRPGVLSLLRHNRRTGRKSVELAALDRRSEENAGRRDPGAD